MNDYKTIINEIATINHAIGAPDLTKPVATLLENNDKTIYIAVLGQFKSGKSSLINSIIGENLLPVGVVPVTAIVTRLRYGLQPKLTIQFIDDKERNTNINELPQFVTEKLNPENIKKIAQVILDHPALDSYKNISLVDTPGLGSFYKHNSETTLQWIPFTGVAIISISAERPLSEEDINLIKGISQYCPEIAIVITKTDLFKKEELAEIKAYMAISVNKAINSEIPIFEYSVIKDSEECRNALIEKLVMPLNLNAENKLHEITKHKTRTIIEQSLVYTKLALQAAMKLETSKDSVSRLLQDIRNNKQHHEREMLLSGTSFKGEVRSKLEKIIIPFNPSIIEMLSKQFNRDYLDWQGSLFRVSRKYEFWLKEKIGNEIAEIDRNNFDQINQIVRETAGYYEYTALRFRQMLDEKLNQELGVHLPDAYWQIDFTGIDKPDISIYRAFDSHLDSLLFFLPMKWFQKTFFKHFSSQIPFETEKNLYRYISDLTGKINKTIDIIHKQALQYIVTEIKTVENILQRANSNYIILQSYAERLKDLKIN